MLFVITIIKNNIKKVEVSSTITGLGCNQSRVSKAHSRSRMLHCSKGNSPTHVIPVIMSLL